MELQVTDIRLYVYCPREIYFNYCMPVDRKRTWKMQYGNEAHAELERLQKRRNLSAYGFDEGQKIFHRLLYSRRLGLSGKLDMIIETDRGVYPVEFKNSSRTSLRFHKYQLMAYGLLLEDLSGKPVRKGFLHFIPEDKVVPVIFTDNIRLYTKRIIDDIREIAMTQKFPKKTSHKRRCVDCEYRKYCADVL